MRLKTAEALVSIGTNLELREEYSGRGMYGEKTSGVVGNLSDLLFSVANVSFDLGVDLESENGLTDFDEFMEDVKNIKSDNMGRVNMIFY